MIHEEANSLMRKSRTCTHVISGSSFRPGLWKHSLGNKLRKNQAPCFHDFEGTMQGSNIRDGERRRDAGRALRERLGSSNKLGIGSI